MALRVTPVVPPSTTWANKPASWPIGQPVFMSDIGTKGSHWFWDGARWKPVNGQVKLATLDATTSSIANTETIVLQQLLPAGALKAGDRIRLYGISTKSGTTDGSTLRIRIGTAGTTADTLVHNVGILAAAQRYWAGIYEIRLDSVTSVQDLVTGSFYGYSGGTALTISVPTSISSAAANPLYISVAILSAGATDTVQMVDCQLDLVAGVN